MTDKALTEMLQRAELEPPEGMIDSLVQMIEAGPTEATGDESGVPAASAGDLRRRRSHFGWLAAAAAVVVLVAASAMFLSGTPTRIDSGPAPTDGGGSYVIVIDGEQVPDNVVDAMIETVQDSVDRSSPPEIDETTVQSYVAAAVVFQQLLIDRGRAIGPVVTEGEIDQSIDTAAWIQLPGEEPNLDPTPAERARRLEEVKSDPQARQVLADGIYRSRGMGSLLGGNASDGQPDLNTLRTWLVEQIETGRVVAVAPHGTVIASELVALALGPGSTWAVEGE